MKRSEALEEIRKILAMNGKDDGEGELEEALLHAMEVLGMLPPFFPPEKLSVMQDEKKYTQYYRWEPEDD